MLCSVSAVDSYLLSSRSVGCRTSERAVRIAVFIDDRYGSVKGVEGSALSSVDGNRDSTCRIIRIVSDPSLRVADES